MTGPGEYPGNARFRGRGHRSEREDREANFFMEIDRVGKTGLTVPNWNGLEDGRQGQDGNRVHCQTEHAGDAEISR
jgi:hypothetical protein